MNFCSCRGQTSYADGGDFGGFSGYDDYVPVFDAPLSFRASSPGAGGRGAEESKAGGSGGARTIARQPTLIASNSISEVRKDAALLPYKGLTELAGQLGIYFRFSLLPAPSRAALLNRRARAPCRVPAAAGTPRRTTHARSSSWTSSPPSSTSRYAEFLEAGPLLLRNMHGVAIPMQPALSFETVTSGVTKRVAAAAFLEVLQLKTWGRIEAAQPTPFADITLAPPHTGSM